MPDGPCTTPASDHSLGGLPIVTGPPNVAPLSGDEYRSISYGQQRVVTTSTVVPPGRNTCAEPSTGLSGAVRLVGVPLQRVAPRGTWQYMTELGSLCQTMCAVPAASTATSGDAPDPSVNETPAWAVPAVKRSTSAGRRTAMMRLACIAADYTVPGAPAGRMVYGSLQPVAAARAPAADVC